MRAFRAKHRWDFVFVILLFCSPFPLAAQDKPVPSGDLKIGFLVDSLKVERWQTDVDQFQKRAAELGAQVQVEIADGNDDLQLQQAQKLLDSGAKALVLVAHDAKKGMRIVAAANRKGVPLICYERLVRNPDVTFFIGINAAAVGFLQAYTLTQQAPKGNYVLLAGSTEDVNAHILHDEQMKVLKPLVDRGDIKVVADYWIKDWSPTEAYARMAEALDRTKGDVTAVLASNDGMAGGAVQAMQDRKLPRKVLVSGQDADLAAIIRILDDTQTFTIYKPLVSQAKLAAEAAVTLAKGQQVKTNTEISVGETSIPAILLSPVVVTKDNIKQTVIKDGFQNLETIQKSLPKEKWPQ
ncbi:MAG TPA: substrate-binding domain-containing protein [Candidatus Acidoferrum sp.]|nr:substrate-binding domain-containing protein [Candidatus Acidoferrum sp.]